MKFAISFLAVTLSSSVFACNVEKTVLAEAQSAAANYSKVRNGETVELLDPQFDTVERRSSKNGVDAYFVSMQYNDSCYGNVTVKVRASTCEVLGKSKINEGTCTDE